MLSIAIQMLVRDRAKYFGIILGVTLASMVITQQGAIFIGLMSRTFSFITDVSYPDIWVMDPKVQHIDDTKPLQSTALYRVRSIEGVAWAMPLFKGQARARLDNGQFQNCVVVGLDDATLTGGPATMVEGELRDLRRADAVIVDRVSAETRLARPSRVPGTKPVPLKVGDTLELNDRRAIVVGIAETTRSFQSQPLIFTTFSRATTFAPRERKMLTFVLVGAAAGQDIASLCDRIQRETGLAAQTRDQFRWTTVSYYLKNTGIPINFGIAVVLGFVIGTIITGFMFFSFTLDNLRYFGTLKAMGASDGMLTAMVLVQAAIVACVGWGLGVGLASYFGMSMRGTVLAFRMPWQLPVVSACAVIVISMLSALLSMRKVIALEPAVVFKG
jgi:putative ABC transport system permease protein